MKRARPKYPEYRKRPSSGWWLANRPYTLYMLRELTSFFIAVFSLLYVYQISILASRDAASYSSYLAFLKNPLVVVFSIVTLAFSLYHSLTWFHLIGKVQPIKIGKFTTTPLMTLIINTVLLGVISYTVIRLFVLRG